jgi:hypothetical protein
MFPQKKDNGDLESHSTPLCQPNGLSDQAAVILKNMEVSHHSETTDIFVMQRLVNLWIKIFL